MKRLITIGLILLMMALATSTAMAVNGPKVGDSLTASSMERK